MFKLILGVTFLALTCFMGEQQQAKFDVIIRHGTVYDGTGGEPFIADIAIQGDTIAAIGDLSKATAETIIDATGLAVCPGFINMNSMSDRSLQMDGRSMSDIKQGVTLEVMGEGWSVAPVKRNPNPPVDSLWTSLDGYFKWLMKKGVSTNVASFVGATSVRNYELGYANRAPTAAELTRMKELVKQCMQHGAMGISSSLIYAPADYASTEELIELAKVSSAHDGIYITHMRSESDHIL
ncbi:MAG TPA: D-aminoacylase, partial [Cyclobacteriaceae bacterium]